MNPSSARNFDEAIQKIKETPPGKEASMYGPLRDIFAEALGYERKNIDIDTNGEGGRPDVTVRADSGMMRAGKPYAVDWIVVEAKDERNAFSDKIERERIFSAKLKYVTINTAWFVMADPTMIVARPVHYFSADTVSSRSDIEFPLDEKATEETFKKTFSGLSATFAGVPEWIERFRKGDTTLIATAGLEIQDGATQNQASLVRLNRRNFYGAISDATSLLQSACIAILKDIEPRIITFEKRRDEFTKQFHTFHVNWKPLVIHGSPKNLEESREHIAEAVQFRRAIRKDPVAARLALVSLPDFIERTGTKRERLMERFGTETGNLVLARILVVRFLEDHKFFGTHKYVCNGGVEAFQQMREYFDRGYTRLLEDAFRSASALYAAAFDENEMDWIIGMDDPGLSRAIEWAMYLFSRFDFSTIRGDALTGIYDRFLDRRKRKQYGEFYTPPAVARYIVDRIGLTSESKVFDPACGSGTFLIEAFDKMVGNDARRNAADADDILNALANISGNDLNSFSAILAQIQIMWQLLPFKSDVLKDGFPEIRIADGDALKRPGLDAPLNLFSEIENETYDAVVGNPPYIRPERLKGELDRASREYFETAGISPDQNSYALFVYKALDAWCKPGTGRLAFIVPLSLFDSEATADLRKMFTPGSRFAIEEIVDLEMVYNHIFDAWTYPMILIAQSRPANPEERVIVRLADPSCVRIGEDGKSGVDFNLIPTHSVRYADLFSPDGRIYTRMTNDRAAIIAKIQSHGHITDVARSFWTRADKKQKIVAWRGEAPPADEAHLWQKKSTLRRGMVKRTSNPRPSRLNALDIYKGENITSGSLVGETVYAGIGTDTFDDAGVWSFLQVKGDPNRPDILGTKAYAVPRIAHCINAAPFNPQEIAFLDTATIFIPDASVNAFPFDLLFLSNVYVYCFALSARMGIVRAQGAMVYPRSLGMMPWSTNLQSKGNAIESLRATILSASHAFVQTEASLGAALDSLTLLTMKELIKIHDALHVQLSSSFDDPDYAVTVEYPGIRRDGDDFVVSFNGTLFDTIAVNDESMAQGLFMALSHRSGETLTKREVLNLALPYSQVERDGWEAAISKHDIKRVQDTLKSTIERLDDLVGPAFGLTSNDMEAVRLDLENDPFLKNIHPIYPGSKRRILGSLQGLDSSSRYEDSGD